MSLNQLKKIAKDLNILGCTTMKKEQLIFLISNPVIRFNTKQLTKYIEKSKENDVLYLVGDNGIYFKLKNKKGSLYADGCKIEENNDDNFNKVRKNKERFFGGDDQSHEIEIEQLKNVLKGCKTYLYVSKNNNEFKFWNLL